MVILHEKAPNQMTNPIPVYTTSEIKTIEQLAFSMPNPPCLMEKAGLAAAHIAKDNLLVDGRNSVLVLAGPGNNGGDALVAARYLHNWGFQVTTIFTGVAARLSPVPNELWKAGSPQAGIFMTKYLLTCSGMRLSMVCLVLV